jgi:hypothetical protein
MNPITLSWKMGAAGLFVLVVLAACVAEGYGGEGYGGGVGYVGGYYEPGGYEYGGWGSGYRVGPPRGGARPEHGRAAPSIPHGARGGGGHSGGGHR